MTDCAALEMLSLLLSTGTVLVLAGRRGPDLRGRRLLVGGSERLAQNGLNVSYMKLTSSRSCDVSLQSTRVAFLAQRLASAYFL